ncbi:MAG: RodZ domain-containing protein [Pseudomonadota bacterium]
MDEQSPPEAEDDVTVAAGVGHWLAEARLDRDLTTAGVAQALHLDVQIVEALESESFDKLGATVFAKGHLRAVAGYLGLDQEEAARRFHASSGIGEDKLPDLIVSYHSKPPREKKWLVGGLIALLALLTLALVWVIWTLVQSNMGADEADSAAQISEPVVSEPERSPGTTEDTAGAQLAAVRDRLTEQPVASADRSELTSGSDDVSTPTPAPIATGTVELRFTESCWYEVRDANGTRVAYGTAEPGLVRQIDAERPLRLILGVADAASIVVDGQALEITDSMRRGRTARVNIP